MPRSVRQHKKTMYFSRRAQVFASLWCTNWDVPRESSTSAIAPSLFLRSTIWKLIILHLWTPRIFSWSWRPGTVRCWKPSRGAGDPREPGAAKVWRGPQGLHRGLRAPRQPAPRLARRAPVSAFFYELFGVLITVSLNFHNIYYVFSYFLFLAINAFLG